MEADADAKAAQYVAIIHQWLEEQADAVKEVALEFLGATSTSLSLKAKGMLFQVLLPSDPCQCEGPSDEMFMIINEDGSASDSLMMALHERIECVRVGPHSLGKVLDVFPKVLRTVSKKRTALHDELVDFRGQMGLLNYNLGSKGSKDENRMNAPQEETTLTSTELTVKREEVLKSSGKPDCKISGEQDSPAEQCSKKSKHGNAMLPLDVPAAATASASTAPETMAPTARATRTIAREFQILQNEIVKAKAAAMISSSNNDQPVAKPFLSNVTVEIPNESNVYLWHIKLGKILFEGYPRLCRDLQFLALRMNEPEAFVLLEATFSGKYPFAPPFIRVIRPRFIFQTGHVTKGGSMCMELLTESGWLPSYSFETVLVQIVNAFIEGEGRIDMRARGQEYTRKEARQAFDEVAHSHGWTSETMPQPN